MIVVGPIGAVTRVLILLRYRMTLVGVRTVHWDLCFGIQPRK